MRVETRSLPTGTQGGCLHGRVEVCAMWARAYGGKFWRRQKLSQIKFIKHIFLEHEKLYVVSRDNVGRTGVFSGMYNWGSKIYVHVHEPVHVHLKQSEKAQENIRGGDSWMSLWRNSVEDPTNQRSRRRWRGFKSTRRSHTQTLNSSEQYTTTPGPLINSIISQRSNLDIWVSSTVLKGGGDVKFWLGKANWGIRGE